jgi:hypothetical protein
VTAPQTLTTLAMILFASIVLAWQLRSWFGDWQPEPRRPAEGGRSEAEIRAAVEQMRRAIEEWEREQRRT